MMRALSFKNIGMFMVFAFCCSQVWSQQDAEYSMYMFNGLYINPAYAGSKEVVHLSALYRHKWVGVEGAPRTGSFSIHTPMKRNQYALGLTMTNDRLGLTDMNSVYLTYAYRIKAGDDTKISLGIQGGFTHYIANNTEVNAADPENYDPTFSVDDKLFLPNFGFGIYVYSKRYYVGLSTPHLLNNSLNDKLVLNASDNVARQYKHYLAAAGLVIGKDEATVKFKPSVFLKYVNASPLSLDVNLSLLIKDRFWVGGSYRFAGDADNYVYGNAVIAMMEFKVTPQLMMGYAYDYNLSRLGEFNTGTHEFMVSYEFGFDKARFVTPRYFNYF
ncbi:MAG: type IX secretion system membrane protein PorP/SprF [Chitinophagales bacterium]|nr:type IX secretion system membrane protein PorP/SprF [Chitinophagales bacterium]